MSVAGMRCGQAIRREARKPARGVQPQLSPRTPNRAGSRVFRCACRAWESGRRRSRCFDCGEPAEPGMLTSRTVEPASRVRLEPRVETDRVQLLLRLGRGQ